jgi:hypothetical protein
MGAYHGKLSFDIFFIKKAIVKEELGWICRCVMRHTKIN